MSTLSMDRFETFSEGLWMSSKTFMDFSVELRKVIISVHASRTSALNLMNEAQGDRIVSQQERFPAGKFVFISAIEIAAKLNSLRSMLSVDQSFYTTEGKEKHQAHYAYYQALADLNNMSKKHTYDRSRFESTAGACWTLVRTSYTQDHAMTGLLNEQSPPADGDSDFLQVDVQAREQIFKNFEVCAKNRDETVKTLTEQRDAIIRLTAHINELNTRVLRLEANGEESRKRQRSNTPMASTGPGVSTRSQGNGQAESSQ